MTWPAATVTFIGDSVTAGFGYCGCLRERSNVSCGVNQPFANAWYFGDNSLSDCAPPDVPNDACSNNNHNSKPWDAPPWSPGAKSPHVAYRVSDRGDPVGLELRGRLGLGDDRGDPG